MSRTSFTVGQIATRLSLPATLFALALGTLGCGSSHGGASAATVTSISSTARSPATEFWRVDADKDNDIESGPQDDTNNTMFMPWRPTKNRATITAITAFIHRYYAAALAGNSTRACEMIYEPLAEAVYQDYGQPPGPLYLRTSQRSCAAVMALLFKHVHAQLAAEVPKLSVAQVRVHRKHAIAVLRFGALPEREFTLRREGRTWTASEILDNQLP